MVLKKGSKLGPYEILALLGAGGMGEVYRARDTRLDRTVAIKILPEQLSANSTGKQRFQREARIISSLNHPHICVLHDVGNQDGIDFIVMEYLEGETLASRLDRGALPIEQVLEFGIQIADALDKAHRSGVVHRDLKPGNIMLTRSGAKLLDFGLAKPTTSLEGGLPELTASTRSPVTEQGVILGTIRYMSPEQLEGKEADARSDLFSFGSVIYEMATGHCAFQGKSRLNVASAILDRDPDPPSSLRPLTPSALDHTIRRCLAKDPEERWQTAQDLKLELKWIAETGSQGIGSTSSPRQDKRTIWKGILLWVVSSLAVAAVSAIASWMLKPAAPLPISRTVIALPPGQRFAGLDEPALALSPDGTQLAYVAVQGDTQQIYVRSMGNPLPRPIPGTQGGSGPFFSPDGQWIGFFAEQKLKKSTTNGEALVTIGDAITPHGASWGSQGLIAFSSLLTSAIQQIPEAGGKPQALTLFETGEVSHRGPDFLPGGKALLFAAARSSFNWVDARVTVQSLATGERKDLVQGAEFPRYVSSGHLLYARDGNLFAVPFDPQGLTITGTARPVVEGVLQSTISGIAQYAVSNNGSLIYLSGGIIAGGRELVWVDRSGKEQPVHAPVRAYLFPRVSPDGTHIACSIVEESTQVWTYDLTRETLTRLTFEGDQNYNAIWSPDGKMIIFQSRAEASTNIYWRRADGSGGLEQLTSSQLTHVPMSWSPDGQELAFVEVNPNTGFDIWMLHLKDRKARPFLQTPFNESAPRFSPNGRWLAYISYESGRFEIYVQPYPGPGAKVQISTEGGTEPMWNRNGRELFYRNGNKMMVVEITSEPTLVVSKPRVLFEGHFLPTPASSPNYDVSPDGQRFLMIKTAAGSETLPTQINVVLNWFEELKRVVPPGKK